MRWCEWELMMWWWGGSLVLYKMVVGFDELGVWRRYWWRIEDVVVVGWMIELELEVRMCVV